MGLWMSIREGWDSFSRNVTFGMGNGNGNGTRVLFWYDKWHGLWRFLA